MSTSINYLTYLDQIISDLTQQYKEVEYFLLEICGLDQEDREVYLTILEDNQDEYLNAEDIFLLRKNNRNNKYGPHFDLESDQFAMCSAVAASHYSLKLLEILKTLKKAKSENDLAKILIAQDTTNSNVPPVNKALSGLAELFELQSKAQRFVSNINLPTLHEYAVHGVKYIDNIRNSGRAAGVSKKEDNSERNTHICERALKLLNNGCKQHELVRELTKLSVSDGLSAKQIRNILQAADIHKKRESNM